MNAFVQTREASTYRNIDEERGNTFCSSHTCHGDIFHDAAKGCIFSCPDSSPCSSMVRGEPLYSNNYTWVCVIGRYICVVCVSLVSRVFPLIYFIRFKALPRNFCYLGL